MQHSHRPSPMLMSHVRDEHGADVSFRKQKAPSCSELPLLPVPLSPTAFCLCVAFCFCFCPMTKIRNCQEALALSIFGMVLVPGWLCWCAVAVAACVFWRFFLDKPKSETKPLGCVYSIAQNNQNLSKWPLSLFFLPFPLPLPLSPIWLLGLNSAASAQIHRSACQS